GSGQRRTPSRYDGTTQREPRTADPIGGDGTGRAEEKSLWQTCHDGCLAGGPHERPCPPAATRTKVRDDERPRERPRTHERVDQRRGPDERIDERSREDQRADERRRPHERDHKRSRPNERPHEAARRTPTRRLPRGRAPREDANRPLATLSDSRGG